MRRDISNGYVVAEVLSKYFPSKVQLHNFDKGSAIDKKLANWQLLQKVGQHRWRACSCVCVCVCVSFTHSFIPSLTHSHSLLLLHDRGFATATTP